MKLDETVTIIIDLISLEVGSSNRLAFIKPSTRMWTRGDGIRYKEPSLVVPRGDYADIDIIWGEIQGLADAKNIGTVSGEFGSSEYLPAVTVGKILFIKQQYSIRYSSKSILKNKSVWRHRS